MLSCGIPKDTHIWLYYPITLGHEYVHVPFYIYVLFSSIIKVIARMYGWFVYRSSTVGLLAVLPQLVCIPLFHGGFICCPVYIHVNLFILTFRHRSVSVSSLSCGGARLGIP